MPRGVSSQAAAGLRAVFDAGTLTGLNEAELLARYVSRHDERAFEVLVARLGPMVLGVCRRLLNDPRDVEDAFQATFLVLVRKAGSLRDPGRLSPWLYGVAFRVASRARQNTKSRASREGNGPDVDRADSPPDPALRELSSVLDEELNRLPEKFRRPIIFVHLEGLSHEQAAAQLGWPVGTVRSRLSRGRDRLRSRLVRRGFAPTLVALGPGTGSLWLRPEVTHTLIRSAVLATSRVSAGKTAAAAAVSGSVVELTRGVLAAMWMTNLKIVSTFVLASAVLGTGSVLVAQQKQVGIPTPVQRKGEGDVNHPLPSGTGVVLPPAGAAGLLPGDAASVEDRPPRDRDVSMPELRVRLETALTRAELETKLYKMGQRGEVELLEALGQVKLLKAQAEDERDRLSDEIELIEAQQELQDISLQAAEKARARREKFWKQKSISDEAFAKAESDRDLERARMGLLIVRLRQVKRRLGRVERVLQARPMELPRRDLGPPLPPPPTPPQIQP
jgi:RNA polymerase sigma factor (sigma-70 family)